ncbi:MAG: hypothetical protein AB7N76_25385 [Planctomycetota bacterium]
MGRPGQKSSVVELVLWDVILAGVAAGLLYFDARQGADAQSKHPPPAASPSPSASASPSSSPGPKPGFSATPEPSRADPSVAAAEQELRRLQEEAKGRGAADALRIYEGASPALQTSAAWRRFWPGEQERLQAAARGEALARCLVRELQVAADLGRRQRVEALIAALPADARDPQRDEPAWADQQRARPKGPVGGTGLQLEGYDPNLTSTAGELATVVGWSGEAEAKAIRVAAEDALLELTTLLGRRLPKPLVLVMLKEGAKPPPSFDVLSRERPGEELAAREERGAWLAARWGVERLLPGGERWTRAALVRYLAGCLQAGPKAGLNALGRAQAALLEAPDGTGNLLLGLAARGPNALADPAGARAVGLLRFAAAEREGAAIELWPALIADARGAGALSGFMTPARATGLEAAWRARLEATR